MRPVSHGVGDSNRAKGRRIRRLLHRGNWPARKRIYRWHGERVGTAGQVSRTHEALEGVRTAASCTRTSLFRTLLSVVVAYRGSNPFFAHASRAMIETTTTVSAKGRAEYRGRRRIAIGVAIVCDLIAQVMLGRESSGARKSSPSYTGARECLSWA